MRLSMPTRQKIATDLGIAKTGTIHISNNEIVADGYKIADVEQAISVEGLQKYLGTKEKDPIKLWEMLIDKAEGRDIGKQLYDDKVGGVEIPESIIDNKETFITVDEDLNAYQDKKWKEAGEIADKILATNPKFPIEIAVPQVMSPMAVVEDEGQPAKKEYKEGDIMHIHLATDPITLLKKKPGRPRKQ